MIGFLRPEDHVDQARVDRGLRMLLYDGMCSQVMGVFTGGAFLVAFALLMGASNTVIGLFAAVGPFAQIMQIPAIFLIEKVRWRKATVVISSILSRLFWVLAALLPWFAPPSLRIPLLIGVLVCYFGLGAIGGCAFNSWMRDLIPEKIMGRYFANRMAVSIGVGAVLSLGAGFGIDYAKRAFPNEITGYSILFGAGALFGLIGVTFMARIPEPRMQTMPENRSIWSILAQPFKNTNYRKLLIFLASWNFAMNFAGPFFVVYMLQRLDLNMTWILGLAVLSQLVNVLFLTIWGKLADRFTNKSVLTVSGPMVIIGIFLWIFTTMPEKHFLSIPILIAIHAMGGISTAGVGLCAGNIALKAAPKGEATAYLATNSLISGMAAMVAPLLGGLAADFFSSQKLEMALRWEKVAANVQQMDLRPISISGLDFVFIIAFLLGLYALHRLALVKEEGEVEEDVVLTHFYAEVRRYVRTVSSIGGVRNLTHFPFMVVRILSAKVNGGPSDKPDEAE